MCSVGATSDVGDRTTSGGSAKGSVTSCPKGVSHSCDDPDKDMHVLTIAVITIVAAWMGALTVVVGLCASAARGDREAAGVRPIASSARYGRFIRTVAR